LSVCELYYIEGLDRGGLQGSVMINYIAQDEPLPTKNRLRFIMIEIQELGVDPEV